MPDIRFPNMYRVDLEKGPAIKQLHQMFMGDKAANRIGAYLFQGDVAVSPGGSCSGTAILNDGSTVALTGTVAGNEIYIDLPPGCYAVPGPIQVYVLWTNGTVMTTVVAGFGTVTRTETGTIIDPGTIIPSVEQLISDIADAVASIPADYSSLLTTIAPEYSTTADYYAGGFVWNGGTLYRAREYVPAGTWNQEKFEPVIVSGGLPYTIGGNNTLELIAAEQSASQFLYYDVGEALAAHVGETVTVSFELMGTVAREIRVYPYQNIGISIADTVRVTPSVGAFSRVSFTTTVIDYGGSGNHAGRIALYDDAGAQTLTTRRFKIELGHTATPWAMGAQDAVIAAQAITEEASAAIAPVETGSASAHNYAIGDWVIWKNALYKATATIATGDVLAVGTNLAGTTVEAELAAAKAACASKAETALSPTLLCLSEMNFVAVPETSTNRRRFTVDRNRIQMVQDGNTYSSYLTFVLTNEFRGKSGTLDSFTPILADLVPITKYPAVCDVVYYLDRRDSSSGVAHLSAVFASVDGENAITVLGRASLARFTGDSGMHRRAMTDPPTGTTHFALILYSNKNDFDFDCVFEIVPNITES